MAVGDWYSSLQTLGGRPSFDSPTETKRIFNPNPSPTPTQSGFSRRGFPEAIQVDQHIPEQVTGGADDTMTGLIDTAFRAPAYTFERPLALVDEITGQEPGSSVLDPVVEGIRGIPLVGEHISNAGAVTEDVFDFTFGGVGAVFNAQHAGMIDNIADLEDDDAVNAGFGLIDELATALVTGEVGKFIDPNAAVTKGDYERWLKERGWSEKDFADIREGRKGWLDFGDHQIPDNAKNAQWANDLGTRMVFDPLNLMFGAGVISKAGKVFKLGQEVATGRKTLRGLAGFDREQRTWNRALAGVRIAKAAKDRHRVMLAVKPLPRAAAARAVGEGAFQGVTRAGVTSHILNVGRRTGRYYRNAAVGTTVAQMGLNVADEIIPEDAEIRSGALGDVLDFAQRWGERKPLSKNDLFSLYSIFHFPGRTIATKMYDNTIKRGVKAGRKFQHENAILKMLYPDVKDLKQARGLFIERAGGEAAANGIFMHIMRTALHERNFLEGIKSLPDIYPVTTLAEAGIVTGKYNQMMNRFMREALEEGALTSRDAERALRRFTEGRGGVLDDLTGGVEQQVFNPEDFWRSWEDWEPIARQVSETFKGGSAIAPGITADIVTEDSIDWALAMVEHATKGGDTIAARELADILRTEPAIFNLPGGEKLAHILTRDGSRGSMQAKEVNQILRNLRDTHAIPRHQYVAPLEQWEGLAAGTEIRTARANSRFNADGTLADDINPDLQNATTVAVQGETVKAVKGAMAGHEGRFVANTRIMRGTPQAQAYRHNIPAGLRVAGLGVQSSVDAVQLIRTRGNTTYATPSILMRLDSGRPIVDGLDTAAIALETTGAPRATAVWRGEQAIQKLGLRPNATEYTFKAGKLTESQWDDLADSLSSFGDRVTINDTTGVVRILVPEGAVRTTALISRAQRVLGNPLRDKVHFRDVVRNKNVTGAHEHTLASVLDEARRTKRYHAARDYIDLGVGGFSGARVASRSGYAQRAREQARGQYPDSPDRPHATPTRWEADQGLGVRGRTTERLVGIGDDAANARWTERIREAGVGDTPRGGHAFNFREGDQLFVTRNGNAGAVVRRDGELVPWRRFPDRNAPADWGDTLAEASAHATWTRQLDPNVPSGVTAIDLLGDHGFVPAARGRTTVGQPDVIYMVRDPDNFLGYQVRKNGYLEAREGHDMLVLADPQQARSQTVDGFVTALHGQTMERLAAAAEDAKILTRTRRLTEIENELSRLSNELSVPARSSTFRQLSRERANLIDSLSTEAAIERQRLILDETINPGNVTFVGGAERDIEAFKPFLDESIEGVLDTLPPGQIQKVFDMEFSMRASGSWVDNTGKVRNSTNYRLKPIPRQGTPYYAAQNEAYEAMVQGRIAAEDGWRTWSTSKGAQAKEILFGRVYAKELQRAQRQEVMNELLSKGATPSEVNRFLRALQQRWQNETPGFMGAKLYRSPDMLSPGQINKLADGTLDSKVFGGFSDDTIKRVGDFGALMQRTGSRTFRNLAKKYPAQDGRGNLGKLIEQWYGKQEGVVAAVGKPVRRGSYLASVGYNTLRFLLDPRWYLMNALEADILGMARYGTKVRGVFGGQARGRGILDAMRGRPGRIPRDPGVEGVAARSSDTTLLSVEEILGANSTASGWMDPRNLYGYVSEAHRFGRPRLTAKLFQQMIDDGSPVIDDLIARHGPNPQSWYDEVDELLFHIDTKGARRAVLDNELAKQLKAQNNPAYDEFLEALWKGHRQSYRDIVHTFHGNVNRANMERLLNSPFLWWPISYQLKTGKWLIDVMTKSFAGGAAELAGTGAMAKLLANHSWAMENNDEYRSAMEDHPALFRALGMMLPMTPFDMGVFMARWSRYGGSWIGAQLGLWDQDPSYPQDPWNFMVRSLSLGPIFSTDIFDDILREFRVPENQDDRPTFRTEPLALPTN